ncbi:MAG: hypothetical protein H6741_05860 [Alphaproteobacteria bacterium]|nr:hypothetical protein [Alphaproteobacteria bacterium]
MLALAALLLSTPAPAGALDKAKASLGLETPDPTPALPEAVYWFNPAETLIFRDQLYYSVFANHLRAGQQVSLELTGPGAPAAPLFDFVTRKDDEALSERWLSFSSGSLGVNKQGLSTEGLSAGDYTLTLRVDGQAVATQAFSLIEAPTALGATVLQVDPRGRAWRPYVTGPYVLMWVPVDLTTGHQPYRAYWWAEGQYLVDTVTAPEVPTLSLGASALSDAPLFDLAPVVLRKQQATGSLDVAWTVDDAHVIGAAHWVNTWSPAVSEGLTPAIYPESGAPLGALTLTAPSPSQAAKVEAVLADVASRPRDPNYRAPRPLSEVQVCALHDSEAARDTYRRLLSLQEEHGAAVWTTWNAIQVRQDPGATAQERQQAQEAMNQGAGKQAAYAAKVQELAARFDTQTQAYREGCLEALRPEGYARIAEVPGG